jgi:serine/threonine protein kinase
LEFRSYGLVHGDIKPANITIENLQDKLVLKMIDMGTVSDTINYPAVSATYFNNPNRRDPITNKILIKN